ncbi:hypothetical protein ES703_21292 [subsurface metagenome]
MRPIGVLLFLCIFIYPVFGQVGQDEETLGDEEDILLEAEALFEEEEQAGSELGTNLVSGYLESAFLAIQEKEDVDYRRFQNANKLKLTLDKKISEVRVHGEINFLFYSGFNDFNLLHYLPEKFLAEWDSHRDDFDISYANEVQVTQAYTVFPTGPLWVSVGRQPLALGTGYAWNPVDPINKKNMLDPTDEIPAHDALKLSLPLPVNGEARLAAIVGEDINEFGGFVSARVNALFDWELSAATMKYDLIEYFLIEDSLTFNTRSYRDTTLGLAFSGQLGEVGLHGEVACFFTENPDNHFRWLLGGDYTFSFQNRIMVELYHNGSGLAGKEDYTAQDWFSYLFGERLGLGRNYGFFSTSQTVFYIADITLSTLASLTDFSLVIFPELKVNFSELAELRLIYYIPVGKDGTEFGTFASSAELRVTGYF